MTRLLRDQGLPRSAASILRGRGWLADHVGERGLSRAADIDLLTLASEEGYTVVTLDADFHALLAISGSSQPSVIRIREEGLKGEDLAMMIEQIFLVAGDAIASGAMVTATRQNVRIKRLPIVRNDTSDVQ